MSLSDLPGKGDTQIRIGLQEPWVIESKSVVSRIQGDIAIDQRKATLISLIDKLFKNLSESIGKGGNS
jgi:hypothetical protein